MYDQGIVMSHVLPPTLRCENVNKTKGNCNKTKALLLRRGCR